jgi:hypothetical protein
VGGLADQIGLRVAYAIVPALLSVALIGLVLSLIPWRRPGPTA